MARARRFRQCQSFGFQPVLTVVPVLPPSLLIELIGQLLDARPDFFGRRFVVGLPINMDGTEGPRCQSTRSFARNFGRLSSIPIVFWDERLSTAAVERMLIAADASRARREASAEGPAPTAMLRPVRDVSASAPAIMTVGMMASPSRPSMKLMALAIRIKRICQNYIL